MESFILQRYPWKADYTDFRPNRPFHVPMNVTLRHGNL